MFGLVKMLFYSFVAVAVGVFIGTFPVGGRTIADRIVSAYEAAPAAAAAVAKSEKAPARKASSARAEAKRPAGPITAGAANSPERTTPDERDALDRLIAARTGR